MAEDPAAVAAAVLAAPEAPGATSAEGTAVRAVTTPAEADTTTKRYGPARNGSRIYRESDQQLFLSILL